ncbi:hypothetical protein COLO4_03007 [Corchorus olitorius]|uniref:Uncharacterized protein n=1 Tax=Corchorus olitorius TaxID=93759 RepID=A0A1R3KZF0_9ROSI|nr:hypothetical protein COLO4_03132 [Corchorus olitorius]OMP12576.1 hypothetical protein COLO4_03007 [Corchorus olitorius]
MTGIYEPDLARLDPNQIIRHNPISIYTMQT